MQLTRITFTPFAIHSHIIYTSHEFHPNLYDFCANFTHAFHFFSFTGNRAFN